MYQRSSGVGKYGSGNLYPYPDRGSVQMTSAEHQNFACNLRKGGGGGGGLERVLLLKRFGEGARSALQNPYAVRGFQGYQRNSN